MRESSWVRFPVIKGHSRVPFDDWEMMAASDDDLYRAHVKNLRAIGDALRKICFELNASISRGDHKTSEALLKTAMLLLGGWSENRLRKLSYEPNGFSLSERNKILDGHNQIGSWEMALNLGFRKRYNIKKADLKTSLSITPRSHYLILLDAIDFDLKPIIEIRNKLAHGQWSRALNNANDDFSNTSMRRIKKENALTLKCKIRVLENLAYLIHDLVAGNHAFERDFDKHFTNLEHARREIRTKSYPIWELNMREKFKRGKTKRTQADQKFESPFSLCSMFQRLMPASPRRGIR